MIPFNKLSQTALQPRSSQSELQVVRLEQGLRKNKGMYNGFGILGLFKKNSSSLFTRTNSQNKTSDLKSTNDPTTVIAAKGIFG